MFKCKRCDEQVNDGVKCTVCLGQFDFPCAGITETGWRKLGDRKLTWKCNSCKALAMSPRVGASTATSSDMEGVLAELKRLSVQMESLPVMMEDLRLINKELAELKSMRLAFSDVTSSIEGMKESLEFVHGSVKDLTSKVLVLEHEIDNLKKTKDDIVILQDRCRNLELQCRENKFLILGDFNQPNINWQVTADSEYLCPSNLHGPIQTTFCDTLTAGNLLQYNSHRNANDRILDLVLSNDEVTVNSSQSPLVEEDLHHKALCITAAFVQLHQLHVRPRVKFLYAQANFDAMNEEMMARDWQLELNNRSFEDAVNFFYDQKLLFRMASILLGTKVLSLK
ncbi:hypothetical protein PYW08_004162 [Mythimna loreyi]|uniref:Uncharacterized protein n=1 Tax=Mythimna loreyi TaxID=667449 RepID=A0ACC2QP40_9NEOP|nr:hypothetical protein PYW08_004162 [Mythimna loreyi]